MDQDAKGLPCGVQSDKCAILEDIISDHFSMYNGEQFDDERDLNRYTSEMLSCMDLLVIFGFYGTVGEIKDIVDPLIGTLDGQNDALSRPGSNKKGAGQRRRPSRPGGDLGLGGPARKGVV